MGFAEKWERLGEKVEPPRGSYRVEIVEGGNAWETKDGREFGKVFLKILDGDLAGTVFEHFMGFQPDGIAEMNKNSLLGYGLDDRGIKSVEDLDDRIGQLVGRTAEVGVSYKDGYMNVNVNGSRPPEGQAPDISGKPVADFASAAASNGVDDDPPPF